jgi:GT2 family glycosyltransferase
VGSQILVVDDASEGEGVTAAARAFPKVEVVRLPRRGGFCAAANAGVRAASGTIVQLLNDDTEVTPGWAGPALARFATPKVAAVTPLVLIGPPGAPGPVRVDSTGDRYFVGGVASKRGHGEVLSAHHLVAGPVFGASGSASFFRKSAFLAVGGLPVELGAYFDDVDLSFRLRRAGHAILYEPASRVYHRVSSSYGRPGGALLALQSRNEELVYWRNLPAWQLACALPLHLAVLAGKALRRLRQGQLLPFLAGRLAALAAAGEVWRHRQRLSHRATITR